MGGYTDKATQKRYVFANHIGDFEYDMSGDEAVVNEDVPVIGEWKDWTGSGGVQTKTQMMLAGTENILQGTDAQWNDNAKLKDINSRGKTKSLYRDRIKKVHIDL
jgi:hypothetical protein